jgi:glycerol-3-phosphate dehydrogenase (NAD(P)+)
MELMATGRVGVLTFLQLHSESLMSELDLRLTRARPANPYTEVAVIGAGSWGLALAHVAQTAGRRVRVWGRDPAVISDLLNGLGNPKRLPDIPLPPMAASIDPPETLDGAEVVLIVTPSRSLRNVLRRISQHIPANVPVVLCAKGIERDTGLLMTQVAEQELPDHPIGVLSGPTFAAETALGYPTAATVAFPFTYSDRIMPEDSAAARLAVTFGTDSFRPYVSDDPIGVEVGGAVKNVIAVACGMMTGAGFAENTRAALITRGMDEMKSLAQALGGRPETVTGLSGAGDLTLTCSSTTSRNMRLGVELGQGIARPDCFEGKDVVVEGEVNAASVCDLARRVGVPMPICETVHAILNGDQNLRDGFAALWARPLEAEPRALDLHLRSHPAA